MIYLYYQYMDTQRKKVQAQGTVFVYNKEGSFAYKTDVKSNKFLLFIDGMYGMMLSIPYFNNLKRFCDQNSIVLVYPQLRSHPHYKIHKIQDDIEDIVSIVQMLDGDIIIMGHSTGCQDSLLYLSQGKDPKVKGVILQAPVSDIEGCNLQAIQKAVSGAKQSGKFYVYEDQVWLSQRFITVYEKRNKQDLFSSYLQEQHFAKWKAKAAILSVVSLKDEYCKHNLSDKFKRMGKVLTLENGNHNIKGEKDQQQLIQGIRLFLKQIGFL